MPRKRKGIIIHWRPDETEFFANFNFHNTSCNWVYIMNPIFHGGILKLSESQFLTSYHTPSKWEQNLNSGLAWKIPWMEEPGRLQSMGSLRVGHNWATSLSCIGEGNGNPLQCSCLENPRDRGAWWAAIYGVAQIRTRLKWLSSSSSSNSLILNPMLSSVYQRQIPGFSSVWNETGMFNWPKLTQSMNGSSLSKNVQKIRSSTSDCKAIWVTLRQHQ